MGSQTLAIFRIMTMYKCMFRQFYYLDRVHSLYILKNYQQRSYFTPILLKYVKYTTYYIVFSIVVNYLKLYNLYNLYTCITCIPVYLYTCTYNRLPEDVTSGSKRVEDIVNI